MKALAKHSNCKIARWTRYDKVSITGREKKHATFCASDIKPVAVDVRNASQHYPLSLSKATDFSMCFLKTKFNQFNFFLCRGFCQDNHLWKHQLDFSGRGRYSRHGQCDAVCFATRKNHHNLFEFVNHQFNNSNLWTMSRVFGATGGILDPGQQCSSPEKLVQTHFKPKQDRLYRNVGSVDVEIQRQLHFVDVEMYRVPSEIFWRGTVLTDAIERGRVRTATREH